MSSAIFIGQPAVSTSRPRGGGGDLTGQRRGSHLSARHPIDGVVDEDGGDEFPPVGGVDNLGSADSSQVAVALIREDHLIRADPLDTGGHRRSPSVGRLAEVHIEVLVRQYCTPYRRHADGPLSDPQFVYHFGDEPVDNPMGAARTVVGDLRRQAFRIRIDQFHIGRDFPLGDHFRPPGFSSSVSRRGQGCFKMEYPQFF